jgi:ADP-L-glycero-D-manno-heptose 6-epimerase
MIIVTGGAGFIGSNIIRALNEQDREEILVVDDLSDASKVVNLSDLRTTDYVDRTTFQREIIDRGLPAKTTAILHQGACSDTMATDGREVMETNFTFSKNLLEVCIDAQIPLIYASSAAVYGRDGPFAVDENNETPLNVYAYSKYLFDQLVRGCLSTCRSQVVGLRYFNVYGPREAHKGRMASVVYQLFQQFQSQGMIRLFEGTGGFPDGEQRRDFVSVNDVALVNLYLLDHHTESGIINVGTGCSRSFNDVALTVINTCRAGCGEPEWSLQEAQQSEAIVYFPLPEELNGKYQSFTEADLKELRALGYTGEMTSLETGVRHYVRHLQGDAKG